MEESLINSYSPLTLAYLGDAVFELMAREAAVRRGNTAPEKLHRRTVRIVRAEAQAAMGHGIWDSLSEEEQTVYRRGRNAKSGTHAKNSGVSDYHHATGLEALFGYLYLRGRTERLRELMEQCLAILEESEENAQRGKGNDGRTENGPKQGT